MSMSDDEPKDEPTDNSEQQADEQATDSDQSAGQAEEQPTDSDQPAEQTEDQVATSNESAEQSVEQPAESDQPAEQAEEQPVEETGQSARQADDSTGGGGSGGGVDRGGPADDAVAAGTGGKLQVKAEFTQEGGPEFAGEISIDVFDHDEKGVTKAFGPGRGVWQNTKAKDNKITTPFIPVHTSRVAIQANARITIIDSASGDVRVSQVIGKTFVFRMPIPNNMLVAGFDVEVKPLDQSIPARKAEEALELVKNMLGGSTLLFQKVEKIDD
jgi:DNA mismatch repair ATPase MutL